MRIVEYAKVIIDNANMLLREDSNLSEQQRKRVSKIPIYAEKLIFLYKNCSSELAVENDKHLCIRIVSGMFHDARAMSAGILTQFHIIEKYLNTPRWTEKDGELFLHIKQYNTLILAEVEASNSDLLKLY